MEFNPEQATYQAVDNVYGRMFADVVRLADARMNGDTTRFENYGSVQSIDLPGKMVEHKAASDAGYLNLDDADPRRFVSRDQPQMMVGLWHNDVSRDILPALKGVFDKAEHTVSHAEYFDNKISELMLPGPWSGDGRNHELSLVTKQYNGRMALVYDCWRAKDMTQDGFDSKPQNDDVRMRVVMFPNTTTGKVDVLWMQSRVADFDAAADKFDQSIRSIKWKNSTGGKGSTRDI